MFKERMIAQGAKADLAVRRTHWTIATVKYLRFPLVAVGMLYAGFYLANNHIDNTTVLTTGGSHVPLVEVHQKLIQSHTECHECHTHGANVGLKAIKPEVLLRMK